MTPKTLDKQEHWNSIYASKQEEELGWYEPELKISFSLLTGSAPDKQTPVIDIGGGTSTLVDDLVEEGYEDVTVLDISEEALSKAKTRLGSKSGNVTWISGDMTSVTLPENRFTIWHDRAVFHFLTTPEERRKYMDNLRHALRPGGTAIIATFTPEAPAICSGLPVERYTPEKLQAVLGDEFTLNHHQKDLHITPSGVEQMYLYTQFSFHP